KVRLGNHGEYASGTDAGVRWLREQAGWAETGHRRCNWEASRCRQRNAGQFDRVGGRGVGCRRREILPGNVDRLNHVTHCQCRPESDAETTRANLTARPDLAAVEAVPGA